MNCQLSSVRLRPWTLEDVEFALSVRNHPDIMKYYRQNEPVSFEDQSKFIAKDIGEFGHYNGRIIEADGVRVGLCSVKNSGEFTIGVLPEFQGKGYSLAAMKLLIASEPGIWSEVFVGNPALEWFISKLGFRVYGVTERAYYKPGYGLVDVVKIVHHD